MAIKHITHLSVYTNNQEETLAWYRENFGFEVQDDDSSTMEGFRWLTLSPKGDSSVKIVLFPCQSEDDKAIMGANTICVLETDDCKGDYQRLRANGVEFIGEVCDMPWGLSAVLKDLHGNPYNLVQPRGNVD